MTTDSEFDQEILAEFEALTDEQLDHAARSLASTCLHLAKHRPTMAHWFENLQILAMATLARRSWSIELLEDDDLVPLKRMAASFRGTMGWDEMEGIEPLWALKDPPLVPEAESDLWNAISAAAAGELDRRKALWRGLEADLSSPAELLPDDDQADDN